MNTYQPDIDQNAWYLVLTKPKQEGRALENLQNQGFDCFLPLMKVEKIRQHQVTLVEEPLFSRYLFIKLNKQIQTWAPVRSTLGVSTLVRFGTKPATVPQDLIDFLRKAPQAEIKRMFTPGEAVRIKAGALQGVQGVYQAHDGESRAYVLIDLLGQEQRLRVALAELAQAA